MIQAFVEKNRKPLSFYYWAARIGGWIFLSISSLAAVGHSVALISRIGDWNEFYRYYQHDVPWGMFSTVFPTGLLVLGVAQLIRYLLEPDRHPDWILRNADKLLYAYTAIVIIYYCWVSVTEARLHSNEPYDFLRLPLSAVFILVELLALVGLAQMLKRLLPMIEESRTLV
jgi:hypothetical protein